MSANNQTLIKQHTDGKWYVFHNIMAEAWDENCVLRITDADSVWNNGHTACNEAVDYEDKHPSEYGVVFDILSKDGTEVILCE